MISRRYENSLDSICSRCVFIFYKAFFCGNVMRNQDSHVSQVGEYVAAFIEFLGSEAEVSFDDIHILGHSLGAHVAGYIGNSVQKKIGRITGLDPAGPAFETPYLKDPEERLDATDANFVDIIHTCAGSLGFLRPVGHVDFYPNGGTFRQPGCPVFSSRTTLTLNFTIYIYFTYKRILI